MGSAAGRRARSCRTGADARVHTRRVCPCPAWTRRGRGVDAGGWMRPAPAPLAPPSSAVRLPSPSCPRSWGVSGAPAAPATCAHARERQGRGGKRPTSAVVGSGLRLCVSVASAHGPLALGAAAGPPPAAKPGAVTKEGGAIDFRWENSLLCHSPDESLPKSADPTQADGVGEQGWRASPQPSGSFEMVISVEFCRRL